MTKNAVYCIIRYAELATKGKNRYVFEEQLMENIKYFLDKQQIQYLSITNPRGRILLLLKTVEQDLLYNHFIILNEYNVLIRKLKYVFGIASYSIAVVVDYSVENIQQAIIQYFSAQMKNCQTFRISTQRIDKNAISSIELDKKIGEFVVNTFKKKVSLKSPEIDIGIELLNNKAFLFTNKVTAYGGLPVGIEGTVLCLIENQRSILAAFLMLKRGCRVVLYGNKEILEQYKLFLSEIINYKTELIYRSQDKQKEELDILQLIKKYKISVVVDTKCLPNNNFFAEKIMQLNPIALVNDEDVEKSLVNLITNNN